MKFETYEEMKSHLESRGYDWQDGFLQFSLWTRDLHPFIDKDLISDRDRFDNPYNNTKAYVISDGEELTFGSLNLNVLPYDLQSFRECEKLITDLTCQKFDLSPIYNERNLKEGL